MAGNSAQRLARLIASQPDPAACEAVLDQLERYCRAQLAGQDAATEFEDVAEHLDWCVACAESYALVYESLLAENALPDVIAPQPDLSFLGARPERDMTWTAALRAAIGTAAEGLRITLSQQLLATLVPQGPALALRGEEAAQPLIDLTWRTPGQGVEELQLSALPGRSGDECDLRIRVALSGKAWPELEGIVVTLRAGGLTRQASTDAWGEVLFSGLQRADLPALDLTIAVKV